MRSIFQFHEKKFRTLPLKQQHKKCVELLDALFFAYKNNQELHIQHLLTQYNTLCTWLELEPLSEITDKHILDRRFFHAQNTTHVSAYTEWHEPLIVNTTDISSTEAFLPVTIFLENLRSKHNIGAIIRTTEAFRLGTLALSNSNFTIDASIKKSSCNSEKFVPIQHNVHVLQLPRPIIAVETVAKSVPYYSFTFPDTCTLAFGNEEYGLSDELLSMADYCISIPLYGNKCSLNVASAFAIIAAEIVKQKRTIQK